MKLTDASLLRLYLSEDDALGTVPLYDAILRKAHEMQLAGGTVLRGVGGYGPASLKARFFQFRTEALPVVVEIIDTPEKIDAFLPVAAAMLESGALTVETVSFFSTAAPA
jgi:uncharacterized protein